MMDIRKWLISPKGQSSSAGSKEKSKRAATSPKKESKITKKRRILESDSDEEPIPKEKNGHKSSNSPKQQNQNREEKKKPVTVSAFFGSAPVVHSEKAKTYKSEKLQSSSVHEDPEFEATINQLKSKPIDDVPRIAIKKEKQPSPKGYPGKGNPKPQNKSTDMEFEAVPPSPKFSPKDKPEKRKPKSRKKSANNMEFEAAPQQKKTVIVGNPSPTQKKHKGSPGYASYLHREGPKALGSKEIPEGTKNCFGGLTFVITGVLDSIERDEAKSIIEKYGGKVTTTLSKNTKYIIIGRDAGSSKLDKAEKFRTHQLDEDGFFDLIRTKSGKIGSSKQKTNSLDCDLEDMDDDFEKELAGAVDDIDSSKSEVPDVKSNYVNHVEEDKKKSSPEKPNKEPEKLKAPIKVNATSAKENPELAASKPEESPEKSTVVPKLTSPGAVSINMWVDKYKPSSMKQIIGQQGDKSNAKKLYDWLRNWKKNRMLGKKPVFAGRWNAQDDGSGYKAALLSGPPGVGKTTTAQLVCKEVGFEYFELNASDTRSKKYLQQSVSQLLGNQTLGDCFHGSSSGKVTSNHVIVMDEVDGMAGNEDRGGMKELIDFIKASKVPIICICNDRNHTKIRSLANYCYDLRFQRPRVEQIKAAMLSVAYKEGVKVSPEALQDVIVASNQDIRQVLHNMSMWSAKSKDLTADQTKIDVGKGTKHIKMSPFDVLRDVFAIGNKPNASIIDKSDLFFHDYSLAPLFVHENYIHVIPTAAEGDKKKHLMLLSEAADSLCISDLIDRQIRSQSSWSLLPTQAIFASVVPGELLRGHLRQMINFPAWLGKNSNKNHMDRVLQELHVHMRMKITGNKTDVALEYLPLLKHAFTKPLIEKEQEGIRDVLKYMEQYYLLREDFDSIIDLSLWTGQTDPRSKINTKTKSAFTRAYNKECGKNPYSVSNVKKKKGSVKDAEVLPDEENGEEEEEEVDDSLENDAMIKVKKPSKKAVSASSEGSSKEKKKAPSRKGKSK